MAALVLYVSGVQYVVCAVVFVCIVSSGYVPSRVWCVYCVCCVACFCVVCVYCAVLLGEDVRVVRLCVIVCAVCSV